MSGKRQKIQRELALEPMDGGEFPFDGHHGAEPLMAVAEFESPASTGQLMEEVCKRENLKRAWQRVKRNKGVSLTRFMSGL